METYRVSVPCSPELLHEMLEREGMKVETVRADWAKLTDPVALWAVVVFSEGFTPDPKKVQVVVDAHLAKPETKGKKPSPIQGQQPDSEKCLAALERIQ